ncbi:HAMP domain-containing sensor histidine kinase [Synechococcus sp. CCY9202]|uniref:sensor histidine kinase n=1 Tax=Synechococcus sp. CCY9202 TaxID=174698 RepID=UPI002B21AEFD|nr:HAMP domain-containing sensor histidine kinase [Synechococcus sp. CCY9202]MEA5423895.1 HAMP domain-containing sensor histidine kinase [Synechococcus sp. CCY9202]
MTAHSRPPTSLEARSSARRPGAGGVRVLQSRGFIIFLTLLIQLADWLSSTQVVVGYLFVVPLLLGAERRGRAEAMRYFLLCCLLTLIPLKLGLHTAAWPASLAWRPLASRLLACLALGVTTELCLRNRRLHTRQLAMEVRLAQADLRHDLIDTLAHDLKTPVLGTLATARLMRQELDPDGLNDLQLRGLVAILSSQERCLRLIEDLLQIFRADIDGLPLHREPLNVIGLAQDAIEAVRPLAEERSIVLELRLPAGQDTLTWLCDAAMVRRLMENLLLNAIGHSLRRDVIALVLVAVDSELRLQVLDRGPGFPAESLAQLFDRFYRADPDRRGSGLGLYLCRQIVEAHHGRITATNRPEGGALFEVVLPAEVPSWREVDTKSLEAPAD